VRGTVAARSAAHLHRKVAQPFAPLVHHGRGARHPLRSASAPEAPRSSIQVHRRHIAPANRVSRRAFFFAGVGPSSAPCPPRSSSLPASCRRVARQARRESAQLRARAPEAARTSDSGRLRACCCTAARAAAAASLALPASILAWCLRMRAGAHEPQRRERPWAGAWARKPARQLTPRLGSGSQRSPRSSRAHMTSGKPPTPAPGTPRSLVSARPVGGVGVQRGAQASRQLTGAPIRPASGMIPSSCANSNTPCAAAARWPQREHAGAPCRGAMRRLVRGMASERHYPAPRHGSCAAVRR